MNRIRQEQMKKYIENNSVATIKELRALFPDVSLMTIHRDLDVLESEGVIVKYRGGVKSVHHPDDVEFNIRMHENNAGKQIMAEKAISLIKPYSSVFLDAGTSNLVLAKNMPDMSINVVTTGPGTAIELCRLHKPIITLCCGTMNRRNLAISGQNTLEILERINIDTAFIGVSGYSAETGFSCGTEADMLIKRMVIKKARTSVVLCGAEKFKRVMPYTFASISEVDYIITDEPMPKSFVQEVKKAGVILL